MRPEKPRKMLILKLINPFENQCASDATHKHPAQGTSAGCLFHRLASVLGRLASALGRLASGTDVFMAVAVYASLSQSTLNLLSIYSQSTLDPFSALWAVAGR
jgi:hypothetical protein